MFKKIDRTSDWSKKMVEKKWKCVIFKCYSSEELITLNTLHEVVPTWYSFHSWVDWSNADKVSCSRRKHIDAEVRTRDLCIQWLGLCQVAACRWINLPDTKLLNHVRWPPHTCSYNRLSRMWRSDCSTRQKQKKQSKISCKSCYVPVTVRKYNKPENSWKNS